MTAGPGVTGAERLDRAGEQEQPIRASDADRAATVHLLQDAGARGLLTFDECSDRVGEAFAARYVSDLRPLTADLPAPPPTRPAAPGWRLLLLMLLEQLRAEFRAVKANGLRSKRSLRTVVVAIVLLVGLVAFTAAAVHGIGDGGGFRGDFRGGFGPR